MIYIYTLIDPIDKSIRYVGKTNNPERRLKQHLTSSKKRKTYNNIWIYNLIKDNQLPIMNIIDRCEESESIEVEKKWILEIYEKNKSLTNLTYIGDIEERNPQYTRNGNFKNSYSEILRLRQLGLNNKQIKSIYGEDYKSIKNNFNKQKERDGKTLWYKWNFNLIESSKIIPKSSDVVHTLTMNILTNRKYKNNDIIREFINNYEISIKECNNDKIDLNHRQILFLNLYNELYNKLKNL